MSVNRYIHCGRCWGILGEIPASSKGGFFDTADCSWPCTCGALNLSSDGCEIKYDSKGNEHWIYFRGKSQHKLIDRLPKMFPFDKLELKFTNPIWKK